METDWAGSVRRDRLVIWHGRWCRGCRAARAASQCPARDTSGEKRRCGYRASRCRDAATPSLLSLTATAQTAHTTFAVGRVDRIIGAVAWVKLPKQFADNSCPILLDQVPQYHVDRHAARLDQRNRFGGVIRPMQHAFDVGGQQAGAPL